MFDADMMSALSMQRAKDAVNPMQDRRTLARYAYGRGQSMDEVIAQHQRAQAAQESTPNFEYRDGVLYQDGEVATPEQNVIFAKTNPYIPQNWMATAKDRAITPEQQAAEDVRAANARRIMMDRQNEVLSNETDFFGRPLGPVVRSEKLPANGIKVKQTSVEAIPAGKVSVPYNPVAGVKPLLNSVLGSLGGPVSRTAKPRTTK